MSRGYGQGGQYQQGGWGGSPSGGYPSQNGNFGAPGGYNGRSNLPPSWQPPGSGQQAWGSSGGWGGSASNTPAPSAHVRVAVNMPGGQAPPPSYSSQRRLSPPSYSSQAPPPQSYSSQAPPPSYSQQANTSWSTPFGNNDMQPPPLPPPAGYGMPPPPSPVLGSRGNGPPSMAQWAAAGAGYGGYGAESQLALPEAPRSLQAAGSNQAASNRTVNVHIDFGQSSSSTAPTSQRLSANGSSTGATAEWRALMDSARAMCDAPIPTPMKTTQSSPGSGTYTAALVAPAPAPAPAPAVVTPAPPALHHQSSVDRGEKKKKTLQFGKRTSYDLGQDRPSGGHKTDIVTSIAGDSPTHLTAPPSSTDSSKIGKRCSIISAPSPAQLAQHRLSVQSCASEYWEDDTIDEDQVKAAQKLANKLALRRGQGAVKK